MTRIGIIGSGIVGQTLAKGFKTHSYAVRIGSRTPEKLAAFSAGSGIATGMFADVAAWAELLVLAVHGTAAASALELAGASNLRGKVVIDTTNPIAHAPPEDAVVQFFTGPNSSLMEQLQSTFPDAKATVKRILEQFGWEAADMGKATAARAIEPLCQLWCIPGFLQNTWTHAFKMLWD